MSVIRKRGVGTVYTGKNLNYIAFPMGGIGAGMLCLEGNGGLTNVSIRHKPEFLHQPLMFSAFCVKNHPETARVLEGQVQECKIYGLPGAGNGLRGYTYGLPRCYTESFTAKFPFATVKLVYPGLPLRVEITGWSPFIPGDEDSSSLPVAALEYNFINSGKKTIEGVYSFHSKNFLATEETGHRVEKIKNGFILHQDATDEKPYNEGNFCAMVPGEKVGVNCNWVRVGWFVITAALWQEIEKARVISNPPFSQEDEPSPRGSIYAPLKIPAGGSQKIKLLFSWYVPYSNLRIGDDNTKEFYRPWYAGRFKDIKDVSLYWEKYYDRLKAETTKFTECFYSSSIPEEVIDAISANLSILKSPTVLRQTDGRLWCWEGCCDTQGCCHGSCTHVWNYAQAIAHLFPGLERTLRQTEFNEMQDERGHQEFRAWLPIRPSVHRFHAAADGQLGGIMRVYRDWRISGDNEWLKGLWEKVKKSLNYCIETWDPEHKGILQEPHHNTYDIEFWGPDGMCGSIYLGALKAASLMAEAVGDDVPLYRELYEKGKRYLETKLFNGEYFYQKIMWKGLKAEDPTKKLFTEDKEAIRKLYEKTRYYGLYLAWIDEVMEIIKKEGPGEQYGKGCLADGVLGAWLAEVCGVGEILDSKKVEKHLLSVFRYNFRKSLINHVNPQRPGYALGDEGGLLLCTWPKGERLTYPFHCSDEVWTGFEYQVASHLLMFNKVKEALEIVRTARARYDGSKRNPFDEYECGHWYGRALSSYGLLQGLTGIRYDAVEKTLYIRPSIKGNFSCFFCTATGYGLAGIKNKKPFVKVYAGRIEIKKIKVGGG
jgi:uncharacterized protein (DUF608 family)